MWRARVSIVGGSQIPSIAGAAVIWRMAWLAYRRDQDAGASPLFPPRYHEAEQAKEALLHVVRRDPHQLGESRSRWTLNTLLPHLDWLEVQTSSGLWQVLDRLGIHYKRGRTYVHSPDPAYEEKLARIQALKRLVQ